MIQALFTSLLMSQKVSIARTVDLFLPPKFMDIVKKYLSTVGFNLHDVHI